MHWNSFFTADGRRKTQEEIEMEGRRQDEEYIRERAMEAQPNSPYDIDEEGEMCMAQPHGPETGQELRESLSNMFPHPPMDARLEDFERTEYTTNETSHINTTYYTYKDPTPARSPTSASKTATPAALKPRPTRATMHRISKSRQGPIQTRSQNQRTRRGRGHRNVGQLWELDEQGEARRAKSKKGTS